MVTLANGEDLYLLTDRLDLSAETILKMYKRRWEIEGFHRLLKDVLGFAHLYSFDQQGIEFLLRVAWLLAVLLYLSAGGVSGRTLDLLRQLVRDLRKTLGITGIWRRNSCTRPRNAKKHNKAQNL
jgi:transposase